MFREYHYTWTFDLQSSSEALWPLASDTNRFNRDTGMPPIELLGNEKGVRRVRLKTPFIAIEWDEEPFEWTYPYRFGILRRYRKGPLAEMRVDCRFEPGQPNGTHIIYNTWVRAANLLGQLTIPLVIGIISAKRFGNAFRNYDQIAQAGGSLLASSSRGSLSFSGRSRLEAQEARLQEQGVDPSLVKHFEQFLDRADELSVQRMRPFALADVWGVERRPVLEMFLRLTRLGIIDMYWELLCPECRGASEAHGRLGNLKSGSHCNTCNIDFTVNFDHNVEVVFRPNPSVRPVHENVEFCVSSPQRQPHVIFSLIVPEGEALPIHTRLDEGRYKLQASGLRGSQSLMAAPGGAESVDLRATRTGWPEEESVIALKPRLNLVNRTEAPRTFQLLRTAWSDQAASAADVTALQLFRDLFANEVLRPGEEISVGSVTLMFTDLRDSTRLYRQIGDAPAFGRVLEHFDLLAEAITLEGGAIVKTMGDSVMAAFRRPVQALRAVRLAQLTLSRKEPRLWLKAGIHHGPCIVVNMNDHLDYFGSTANIAARLAGFSNGGEIIFSEPVLNDPEVQELLEQLATPDLLSHFQADLKGFDEPLPIWRLTI